MLFVYTLAGDPASEEIVKLLIQSGKPFKTIPLGGNKPAKKFLKENGYTNPPHLFDGNFYVGNKSKGVLNYLKE